MSNNTILSARYSIRYVDHEETHGYDLEGEESEVTVRYKDPDPSQEGRLTWAACGKVTIEIILQNGGICCRRYQFPIKSGGVKDPDLEQKVRQVAYNILPLTASAIHQLPPSYCYSPDLSIEELLNKTGKKQALSQ